MNALFIQILHFMHHYCITVIFIGNLRKGPFRATIP